MKVSKEYKKTINRNPFNEKLKKERQAQEGPVKINIKYSDTDQTIRREALRLLEEWGYHEPPEDSKK